MFRIDKQLDGGETTLRICGRIQITNVPELRAQISSSGGRPRLDLEEVKLVDRASVRFLLSCEAEGIELLHCPPYIQEWMLREKIQEAGLPDDF